MTKLPSTQSSQVSRTYGLGRHIRTLGLRLLRGFLAVVGIGVLAGLAGRGYEGISASGDADRYPPPGPMVDVGGFRMHINCTGEGDTTVVLDAGLSGASLDWNLVQPALSGTTRVCSYDRAGMGWSEPSPAPRTPEQIAKELHVLLTNAGISPPYVLVGHSLGGKNIRMFALQHPDEVAGMVLIDARSEYVDAMTSPAEVASFRDSFRMQGFIYEMARKVGIARLFGGTLLGFPSTMPGETRKTMALLATESSAITASTAEAIERASSDSALGMAPSLGSRPLVVLAAGDNMRGLAFWPEGQRAQAALSTQGRLEVVEGSGHYIHWQHPDIVIGAIRDVLSNTTSGTAAAR